MQNQVLELMKHFNDNAVKTAQRMTELNLKTFETLTTKQTALVNTCFESGIKNVELLSKAKDYKDIVSIQKNAMVECNEKWVSNVRDTAETMTNVRNEFVAIFEEAKTYATASTEKVVELSKKVVAENVEKTTEAVEKATSQVVQMAKEAAALTKENTDKVVAATEAAAAQTVQASKKVAAKAA